MQAAAALEIREWSIDRKSGHCGHGSGLQAYFDPEPTPSGALRCIGPFSGPGTNLTEARVKAHMHDLTAALESLPEHSGRYLLWGAYQSRSSYREHRISLLGQPAGFIPNPALRSELGASPHADLNPAREWRLAGNRSSVTHRSGLTFELDGAAGGQPRFGGLIGALLKLRVAAPRGGADAAIMHPRLLEDSLSALAEIACEQMRRRRLRPMLDRITLEIEAPLFRWHEQELAEAS